MQPISSLPSILPALALFAFTASITPGPNNIMLTASGANYGFVRTLPHAAGIWLGFLSLLSVCAAGLGALFTTHPTLHLGLKYLGASYLFYLAWRIASAPPRNETGISSGKPFTWWQAALFQYANPKAWVMAISSMTAFTRSGDSFFLSALWVIVIFTAVAIPCILTWAGLGTLIGRWLRSPRSQRTFNVTMGVLTACSVVLIFN